MLMIYDKGSTLPTESAASKQQFIMRGIHYFLQPQTR
jgi:hypothetical protein